MDLWGLHALRHEDMWAKDRIHLTPEGHHRVAQAALVGLGLDADDANWRSPLPRTPKERLDSLRDHGSWIVGEVGPWVARRVKGESSGDGRAAKYPEPTEVLPEG